MNHWLAFGIGFGVGGLVILAFGIGWLLRNNPWRHL